MKTYKRYHPVVWLILIIPIAVLSFGIKYYNSNRLIFGINAMVLFFILMDVITVILTYAAYLIEKKNIKNLKSKHDCK
jgi:uncharacterized membrane protein